MPRLFILTMVLVLAGCHRHTKAIPQPTPAEERPPPVVSDDALPPDLGYEYLLPPIYFDQDKAALRSDQDADTVARHAATMLSEPYGNRPLILEGHCDERGGVDHNYELGMRRAELVRQMLVKNGVPAGRVQAVSFGESLPIDLGHDEAAWARNRRVEFRVEHPPNP